MLPRNPKHIRQLAFFSIAFVLAGFVLFNLMQDRASRGTVNYPPKNDTVLAFGDSLTVGIGAPQGKGYVDKLAAVLDRPVLNYGRAGDTTASALSRINTARAEDAGTVIVFLGGNDALRQIPENETFDNLAKIIDAFQEDGAYVILVGVQNKLWNDTYSTRFTELAEAKGVGFVPNVLEDIIGNPELLSDRIHPNEAGYRRIADRILSIMHPR